MEASAQQRSILKFTIGGLIATLLVLALLAGCGWFGDKPIRGPFEAHQLSSRLDSIPGVRQAKVTYAAEMWTRATCDIDVELQDQPSDASVRGVLTAAAESQAGTFKDCFLTLTVKWDQRGRPVQLDTMGEGMADVPPSVPGLMRLVRWSTSQPGTHDVGIGWDEDNKVTGVQVRTLGSATDVTRGLLLVRGAVQQKMVAPGVELRVDTLPGPDSDVVQGVTSYQVTATADEATLQTAASLMRATVQLTPRARPTVLVADHTIALSVDDALLETTDDAPFVCGEQPTRPSGVAVQLALQFRNAPVGSQLSIVPCSLEITIRQRGRLSATQADDAQTVAFLAVVQKSGG